MIANVENLAHGKGITRVTWGEVQAAGVDIGTGGNHIFSKPEATELLDRDQAPIVRPLNFPNPPAGQGQKTFQVGQKKLCVINLLGEHGMPFAPVEGPFAVMAGKRADLAQQADAVIVDLHAEVTSEKVAMGWYLDGHASLVVGTHTHVATADARILPKGTGYVTDLGMVGLRDSSLGVDKDLSIQRFVTGRSVPFEIPEHGIVALNGILADIQQGRTSTIERIYRETTI